jgi:iron complex transport system permease protein
VIVAIWVASALVLVGCVLASFRLDFAGDPELLLRANGARVLLGAAAGAARALGGALRSFRFSGARGRPLAEIEAVAGATGAAVGGFSAVSALPALGGGGAVLAFAAGALLGAALGWGAARMLDRGSRWSNLGVALLLGAVVAGAAVAGSYSGARRDFVQPVVAWLLGDLGRATPLAAGLLAAALVAGAGYALVRVGTGDARRLRGLSLVSTGAAVGAAGPLAFVGSFVPRTVGALAPAASPRAALAASVAAGAAAVAAIDAAPRLLVGGYALPFNVAATMLAVPVVLSWNRARLRASGGPGAAALEALELAGIAAATVIAGIFAWFLTVVVRGAT